MNELHMVPSFSAASLNLVAFFLSLVSVKPIPENFYDSIFVNVPENDAKRRNSKKTSFIDSQD
jgi:hypothetical protein